MDLTQVSNALSQVTGALLDPDTKALAVELEGFVEDELARGGDFNVRQATRVVRGLRWVRNHPTLSITLVVALLAVIYYLGYQTGKKHG